MGMWQPPSVTAMITLWKHALKERPQSKRRYAIIKKSKPLAIIGPGEDNEVFFSQTHESLEWTQTLFHVVC